MKVESSAEDKLGVLTPTLDRRFEAVIFDWDGTAVSDRSADAEPVRDLIHGLCASGMDVAVVSGTHLDNVDNQLRARPPGPGRLYLCPNRGSEVFRADVRGVRLLYRRRATRAEEDALTAAAEATACRLAVLGLRTEIVGDRLNRRKIDLIPEPEWVDPPRARIADLLGAVKERLSRCGVGGLPEVVEFGRTAAVDAGLPDARITNDAKHVEIGLTDKSDSARWLFRDLWLRGIGPGLVLIIGDEMGALGGVPGSDSMMLVPAARRATAVTVGVEPEGPPLGVIAMQGGSPAFFALLRDQLARTERGEVPEADDDPDWLVTVEGLDPDLERVHEAWLTVADGRIGTSGTPIFLHISAVPAVRAAGVYEGKGPETQFLPAPTWNQFRDGLPRGAALRRSLDLRSGLQRQEVETSEGKVRVVLFSSAIDRSCTVGRGYRPSGGSCDGRCFPHPASARRGLQQGRHERSRQHPGNDGDGDDDSRTRRRAGNRVRHPLRTRRVGGASNHPQGHLVPP